MRLDEVRALIRNSISGRRTVGLAAGFLHTLRRPSGTLHVSCLVWRMRWPFIGRGHQPAACFRLGFGREVVLRRRLCLSAVFLHCFDVTRYLIVGPPCNVDERFSILTAAVSLRPALRCRSHSGGPDPVRALLELRTGFGKFAQDSCSGLASPRFIPCSCHAIRPSH